MYHRTFCISLHFIYISTRYIVHVIHTQMIYLHLSNTYITNLKYHRWQQSRVEVFTWPWYLQGSGGSDHQGGEFGDRTLTSGDFLDTWHEALHLNIGLLLCPVCLLALPGSACFFFQVSGWRGWVCLDLFDNFSQIIHGLEWFWRLSTLEKRWKLIIISAWLVRCHRPAVNSFDVHTNMSFVRFVWFHYTCDTCSSQKVFICVLPSS